jgi:hypothetical protein
MQRSQRTNEARESERESVKPTARIQMQQAIARVILLEKIGMRPQATVAFGSLVLSCGVTWDCDMCIQTQLKNRDLFSV